MPREQREQRKREKLEKLKKVILTRFQHSFISFQMKILKVNYRSSRCSHGVLITFFQGAVASHAKQAQVGFAYAHIEKDSFAFD